MSGSKIVGEGDGAWCPKCGDQPVISDETGDGTTEHRCANGHEWTVAADGGRAVEDHLWTCVDADGQPVRAYHEKEPAVEARESDAYADQDCVGVIPDVPLMGVGGVTSGVLEHVRDLLDGQPNTFEPEILDHLDRLDREGFELAPDHVPDPGTPRPLVYWDLGLIVGYYSAREAADGE